MTLFPAEISQTQELQALIKALLDNSLSSKNGESPLKKKKKKTDKLIGQTVVAQIIENFLLCTALGDDPIRNLQPILPITTTMELQRKLAT